MAALRERLVRIVTVHDAERYEAHARKQRRKLKAKIGRPFSPGRSVRTWEIVATSPEEMQTGLFQPVGAYLTFIPGLVEGKLWERIRLMDQEEYRDIWSNPYWGIKVALKKMGWSYPGQVPQFPVGLLDIVHTSAPAGEGVSTVRRPYEEFITRVWIPRWLYGSQSARNGRFDNWRRAQAIASAFGISVDTKAKQSSWYRTDIPEVLTEAQQSLVVPEDTYEFLKQSIISDMEQSYAKQRPFEPDWNVLFQHLRGLVGPNAQRLLDRFRVELAPIIDRMKSGMYRYEENSRRANHFRSKKRRVLASFRNF